MCRMTKATPSGRYDRIARAMSWGGPMVSQGVTKPCLNPVANSLNSWMCLASSPAKRRSARPMVVFVEMRPNVVEHERKNELLDQAECVKIAVTPDLVEKQFFLSCQKIHRVHPDQRFGQEGACEVQLLVAANDVLDSPSNPFRSFQNFLEVVFRFHGCLPPVELVSCYGNHLRATPCELS